MAVAAYASLLSLSHVLDNVQLPARRHRLHLNTQQIRSLQDKVKFLLDFLEVHSQGRSKEIQDLARQIAVVADEVEDVVDFHVVNQLSEGSRDQSHDMDFLSSFYQCIDKVMYKIDSITKELMMIKGGWGTDQDEHPRVSVSINSSKTLPSSGNESTMVGFDEQLIRVMDELTRDEPNLQIFPIIGMGGIGKTTLARSTFMHPYVVHFFEKRIWLTISQEYSIREILVGLLNDGKDQESNETLAELGERLYKSLCHQRYLIVMDDVWSTRAWDDLKLFFPNNRNGSRVILTTRLSSVAVSLGSHNPYLVNFLDDAKSWNLLCQKVFAQEVCPHPELEEIGKKIAKCCNGLPLSIVVIGGLLATSNMTREYWNSIAENVNSLANLGSDDYCLKILSLSYNNLPIHLKPCFLYFGVFPEDHDIFVSELMKLWVVEGFIKPQQIKAWKKLQKAT